MTRPQREEVGRCEGCGKFKRWSEMGFMNPDGSLVLCQKCASKHAKCAALNQEAERPPKE